MSYDPRKHMTPGGLEDDIAQASHASAKKTISNAEKNNGLEISGAVVTGILGAVAEYMWIHRPDNMTAEEAAEWLKKCGEDYFHQFEEQDRQRYLEAEAEAFLDDEAPEEEHSVN